MLHAPWPAVPRVLRQPALLSGARVSQLFSPPAHIFTHEAVRLFCSPGSSVQIFFFFLFPPKAPATLAGFSFSVSNNSAFLNTGPPLRLSVLFLSLCVLFPSLPCSCCCSFFPLHFFPLCMDVHNTPLSAFLQAGRAEVLPPRYQTRESAWVTDAEKVIVWRKCSGGQGGNTG